MLDLERRRLSAANEFVKRKMADIKANEGDFVSIARRLPTLLLNSGLLLTIAYLQKRPKEGGRGKKAEELVLEYLKERLRSIGLIEGDPDYLLGYLLGKEPETITLMLDEALNSAEALKLIVEARFSEAEEGG